MASIRTDIGTFEWKKGEQLVYLFVHDRPKYAVAAYPLEGKTHAAVAQETTKRWLAIGPEPEAETDDHRSLLGGTIDGDGRQQDLRSATKPRSKPVDTSQGKSTTRTTPDNRSSTKEDISYGPLFEL